MTLLDPASCSQRIAGPSPCPRQQQVRVSLDHGPYGLFGGKRMGRTQSLRIGPREEVEGSQGGVEPKKVGRPREVANR
jgi:hypothetical protein